MSSKTPHFRIKSADMAEDMQAYAFEVAAQVIGTGNTTTEKENASFIRKAFEEKYHGTWHCIVGRSFGSYVTHETKHFIYFTHEQTAILLFKSG
jgi:dynein light chain LC8-type